MKYFLLTLLLLVFFFRGISQEIPNGNFENWVKSGNYEDPLSWITPNMLLSALSVSSVKKEINDVQSGVYSARLENVEIFGGTFRAPGFMTLGMFSFDPGTFESRVFGGIPYTNRPKVFRGYYKYTPSVMGDTGMIAIVFFKFDTLTQTQDTIGGGTFKITGANNEWQKFSININYIKPDLPDSMNIVVLSSQSFQPPVGSVLLVDSFYFDHTGNIQKSDVPEISWYVSGNTVIVKNPLEDVSGWSLYDFTGKLLMSGFIQENETLKLRIPEKGLYIIILENHSVLVREKLLIR